MKKLLSSIVLIFAFSTLYAQNYRAYSIEALYKLESLRAFVLGGDTVFNTTKLSPMDTILVTLEYLKDYAGGGGLPPITGDDIGKSLMVANDTTAKWLFNNDAIFKTGEHVSNLGIVKATVEERLQLNSTPMVNKIHTYNLASGVTFPVVIHAETAQNAPNGYSGDFTITAANNTFANGVDATISHSYKLYMPDANTLKMQWVTGQEIYDGYWGDKMWFRLTESGQAQQLTSKSYVDLEPKGVARAYTKPDTLIIKLRDSTLVKTYLQTGGGGTMNHAELSNLGYGVSGHTGFAGTAVENTFTQNQKIEKATPDLILNSTSGNARIEFQHNGNQGGQINALSDGRLEIRSASDKYINLYNTFRWPVIPSPLVTPELKGMTYFNSNLNQFLGYDGTRWVNLGDTVFGGKFQLYTDTLTWDATKYNLSFYEPKLPDPPTTTADRYFLNANKVWATVPTGAGAGYLGNMYFTPEPSDVAGYFNLNSTPPIAETEKAATASNGEVLVASYIRQTPIGVSVIDGGEWGGVIRFKLSGNQGVSRMRIEIYIRSQNGTENVLFSQLTDELNSTVYVYNPASFQKPSFTVDPNGRLGVKVYFTTTATNITLTYIEGGTFASFITTPIRIRHSELRDWNIDPAYQHVTQGMKDSIKITNQGTSNKYIWAQNYPGTPQPTSFNITGTGAVNDLVIKAGGNLQVYGYSNTTFATMEQDSLLFYNLTGQSILKAQAMRLTAPQGIPPLFVTSTTLNTNLNADLLDGRHASDFQLALTNPVTGTGTANYIPKWGVGGTSLVDSYINESGGILYTGTISISETSTNGSGILIKNRNNTRTFGLSVDATAIDDKKFSIFDAVVGVSRFVIDENGNAGVKTTDPTQALDVNGNARFRAIGNDPMSSLLGVTSDGTLTTNIKIPSDKLSVAQVGHGLVVGDWIYLNGTNYEKAIASSNITADVIGVVVSVESADNFTFQYSGVLSGSFAAGQEYYLSTVTAGAIGAEPSYSPGQVRQFVGTGMIDGSLLIEIDIGLKISTPAISGEVGGGTITSVSGTGSVNGITLSGTVTSSGTITLGGVLSGIENSQLANSSITINESAVSLGGSTTITPTMIGALQADYPSSLSINQTYLGNTISGTAGEDLAFGDFVYYKWADKKWWKASASAYATARTRGVIVEAITAESTGKVLIDGFVRNDTWAWTAAEVWLSITAGEGTSTQPSTKGNQIQFLGTAINETHLLFKPSQDIGEK